MKSYLAIIRFPNLMIMALSMILVRYCLIQPILQFNKIDLQQNDILFVLLVLSIVLLGAGGNVINDLKDVEADKINKPGKNLVSISISSKNGYTYYYALTSLGLIIGLVTSYLSHFTPLFLIHIFIGLSLWMYSNRLNNIPLVGNALISALLASLPWIVLLFDLPSVILSQQSAENIFMLPDGTVLDFKTYFSLIVFLVMAYSLFAYLQNLAREIIKDIIDIKGDSKAGYKTVPTFFGTVKAKRIVLFSNASLLIIYIAFLILVRKYFVFDSLFLFLILSVGVLLPLFYSMFKLSNANEKKDFQIVSNWNKISQLIGLLTMLYFYFIYI